MMDGICSDCGEKCKEVYGLIEEINDFYCGRLGVQKHYGYGSDCCGGEVITENEEGEDDG
jgi:transposase